MAQCEYRNNPVRSIIARVQYFLFDFHVLRRLFPSLYFVVFLSPQLLPQEKVLELSGGIFDAETLQPLPYANLRVQGTTKGTTSNTAGKYRLILPPGHFVIIVSYIGYLSDTLYIHLTEQRLQRDILLRPTTVSLSEITVSAHQLDPADEIIRRAIAQKKRSLGELHAYEFDAYTKTVLQVRKATEESADTVIGGILETHTKAYWKAPDKYKEIVRARRQTTNFPEQMNIFTVGRVPNLNDDVVMFRDLRVVGPTALNAFDYYRFRMLDTAAIDDVTVWRIRIIPRTQALPLFDGIISIMDRTFAIMAVDVHGNEAFDISPWSDVHIRQQFALYEEKFWLPIELQQTADITISLGVFAATVKYIQHCVVHEYHINPSIPDEVFDRYRLVSPATTDRVDTTLWQRQQFLRLTVDEQAAYHRIDSLMAIPNIRRDLAVLVTRAPLMIRKLPITTLADFLHFNRVEGWYTGFGLRLDRDLTSARVRGGYGFSDEKWKYALEIEQSISGNRIFWVGGEVYRRTQFRESYPQIHRAKQYYSPGTVTLLSLLSKNDPLDYYLASGWSLFGKVVMPSSATVEFRFLHENHSTVIQASNFSLLNTSVHYRINPSIAAGKFRSGIFSLSYDTRKFIDIGWFETEDRSEDSWTIGAQLEQSSKSFFRSDFDFTRFVFHLNRWQRTIGQGALDIRATVAYSRGSLPPQRLIDLEATAARIADAGRFRTARVKEFVGDAVAMLLIEYHFGTLFLRPLGVSPLKDLDFILYVGFGWSSLSSRSLSLQTVPVSDAKRTFHEAGFSLGRLFTFLRVDFTWRLTHRLDRNFAITLQSAFF
jgi:hypothetical protein